jgi:hypothetical protein
MRKAPDYNDARGGHRRLAGRILLMAVLAVSVGVAVQLAVLPKTAASPVILKPADDTTSIVGADADQLGTNWYPNAAISPGQLNSSGFGQLLDVTLPPVDGVLPGQIYAQPIVADGILLVVTENDNAYGLDPTSGAVLWSENFGQAWQSSTINCGDLTPSVGITGTPVVDTTSGVEYFVTDTTPASGGALWQMQAVEITTGQEVANFPVAIEGAATNDTSLSFDPVYQMQRPGLALVNGEVYAAFGSHCDLWPWYGWIAGVTTGGALNDMWVDETGSGDGGAGIWGPGGIVVDAAGNLYVATGNGNSPPVGPGSDVQPSGLGECVIRLSTAGAHLQLADYFCPSDADTLDAEDGDLGSGSPTGLPASFGTAEDPDLLVEAGKSGEVYLLDRDDLGGFDQGPGGSDDVVSETGPLGGVWGHPGVWPGDGGYIYITTASPGGTSSGSSGELDVYQRVVNSGGQVSLSWVGDVPSMLFGAGSPVVTSEATTAGSAVVWDIVPTGSGNEANLVAYGAVPVGGTLPELWDASVGNAAKFSMPLPYDGRVYVGNYDGQLLAFGSIPTAPPLTGGAVEAPATALGASSQVTATFTASGTVTVTGTSISTSTPGASGAFTTPPLASSVQLSSGSQLSVPVSFVPQVLGEQDGTLILTTNLGTVSVPVSGQGIVGSAPISATPASVNFGVHPIGGPVVDATLTLENTSLLSVTLESVTIESGTTAPFSIGTLPDPLPDLAPGETLTVTVVFSPPRTSGDFVQSFDDHVVISTGAGNTTVPLEASAAPPPQIDFSALKLGVGTVAIGQSGVVSFTIGNRGGTPLTITESKPPATNGFAATTSLEETAVILPHTLRVETVRFSPTRTGPASASWVIEGDDGSGVQTITFMGTGARQHLVASPWQPGWRLSGHASIEDRLLQLTPNAANVAGAAFWATPVAPNGLRASFTATMTGGTGGDGLTFALVDAESVPSEPGGAASGLGLSGKSAVAVALQTFPNAQNRAANSVGVVTATRGSGVLKWQKAVETIPELRAGPVPVTVIVSGGVMTVVVAGFTVLNEPVSLPKQAYVGFTAGTGSRTDRHLISSVELSYP